MIVSAQLELLTTKYLNAHHVQINVTLVKEHLKTVLCVLKDIKEHPIVHSYQLQNPLR